MGKNRQSNDETKPLIITSTSNGSKDLEKDKSEENMSFPFPSYQNDSSLIVPSANPDVHKQEEQPQPGLQDILLFVLSEQLQQAKSKKRFILYVLICLVIGASAIPLYNDGVNDYKDNIEEYRKQYGIDFPNIDNETMAKMDAFGSNISVNAWCAAMTGKLIEEFRRKIPANLQDFFLPRRKGLLASATTFAGIFALGSAFILLYLTPEGTSESKKYFEAVITLMGTWVLNISGNNSLRNFFNSLAGINNQSRRSKRLQQLKKRISEQAESNKLNEEEKQVLFDVAEIEDAREELKALLGNRLEALAKSIVNAKQVPPAMKELMLQRSPDILADLATAMSEVELDSRSTVIDLLLERIQKGMAIGVGFLTSVGLTWSSIGSFFSSAAGLKEVILDFTSGSWVTLVSWIGGFLLSLGQNALSAVGGFMLGYTLINMIFDLVWDLRYKTQRSEWPFFLRTVPLLAIFNLVLAAVLTYDSFYTGAYLTLSVVLPKIWQTINFYEAAAITPAFNFYYTLLALLYFEMQGVLLTNRDTAEVGMAQTLLLAYSKLVKDDLISSVLPKALATDISLDKKDKLLSDLFGKTALPEVKQLLTVGAISTFFKNGTSEIEDNPASNRFTVGYKESRDKVEKRQQIKRQKNQPQERRVNAEVVPLLKHQEKSDSSWWKRCTII